MILKGRKVYYHHIIVERAKQPTLYSGYKKQAILVKCDSELLHGTNSSRYVNEYKNANSFNDFDL